MEILAISGSNHPTSTNLALIRHLQTAVDGVVLSYFDISTLPTFRLGEPSSEAVRSWQSAVESCDAVVITTPEYLHNIPAVLKSALEWLTESGELHGKAVLPITLTPAAPRGERAMQSLLWSLEAVNARVEATLPLYLSDMQVTTDHSLTIDGDSNDMLVAGIEMLKGS